MLAPQELFQKFPISDAVSELIQQVRSNISEIIHRRSNRFLVVVGPCSIHDTKAAIEYATRLSSLRQQYQQQLEIVMRVYFEKPRTTIGWKGLINDPELNGSYNVNKGLQIARELLIDINELGVPAGCEFLDAITAQYYADLVSWGAIGARTTESQIHRELASGLSCPIGFKNGTNGNVDIAADAVIAAKNQHVFPGLTEQGNSALFTTAGNHDGHVILRGGSQPNYDADSVKQAVSELEKRTISTGLMIDMSHANSQKQFQKQVDVGESIATQIKSGSTDIVGCMIESHLVEGNQKVELGKELVYGQSITDACINFETTESVIADLADAVKDRV